jgi:hypothetical protein
MTPVYAAADPVEVEILRAYLAAHGIDTVVLGSPLWGARGELQADAYPRLMLQDERDESRARDLLRRYERGRHAHASWICACGEHSPVTFEICWACGSERPTS